MQILKLKSEEEMQRFADSDFVKKYGIRWINGDSVQEFNAYTDFENHDEVNLVINGRGLVVAHPPFWEKVEGVQFISIEELDKLSIRVFPDAHIKIETTEEALKLIELLTPLDLLMNYDGSLVKLLKDDEVFLEETENNLKYKCVMFSIVNGCIELVVYEDYHCLEAFPVSLEIFEQELLKCFYA